MAKMNKAPEAKMPHNRVKEAPAAVRGGSEVGNEKKADVRRVQEGGSKAEARDSVPHLGGGIKGAVRELHSQHPVKHDDHGPHHGHDHHIRHEPLHGLKK